MSLASALSIFVSYLCYEGIIFLLNLLSDAPQPFQSLHLARTLLPLLSPTQNPAHQHHRHLEQHPYTCAAADEEGM